MPNYRLLAVICWWSSRRKRHHRWNPKWFFRHTGSSSLLQHVVSQPSWATRRSIHVPFKMMRMIHCICCAVYLLSISLNTLVWSSFLSRSAKRSKYALVCLTVCVDLCTMDRFSISSNAMRGKLPAVFWKAPISEMIGLAFRQTIPHYEPQAACTFSSECRQHSLDQ